MRFLDVSRFWRKVRVCVYTAVIDNYDVLQSHRFAGKAKMFCITDSPDLCPPDFKVHRAPRMFEDPIRDARFYKILPHRFLLPRLAPECDISIWMDANFQFDTERDIGEWAIERLQGRGIAILEHPTNDDAYHEAERCKHFGRDSAALLDAQVARYRNEGFPEASGLVASGLIIRDHRMASSAEFCDCWWDEVSKGSVRDQVSFNYVAWKTKIPFAIIEKLQALDCFTLSIGRFQHHQRRAEAGGV